MTDSCLRPDELETLLELAPDDPRAAHLEHCARCRALLAAYRRYLEVGAEPADARQQQLEARLQEALEAEILGTPAADGETVTAPDSPARFERRAIPDDWDDGRQRRQLPPLLRRFLHGPLPFPFPAQLRVAAAAALVVALVLVIRPGGDDPGRQIRLRDDEPVRPAPELAVFEPELAANGSVRLRWCSYPQADDYRVLLFDADLREVDRRTTAGDTVLTLTAAQLDALGGGPESGPESGPETGEEATEKAAVDTALTWRIEALVQGDVIRRSAPAGLARH
jgi:hypothetical protein